MSFSSFRAVSAKESFFSAALRAGRVKNQYLLQLRWDLPGSPRWADGGCGLSGRVGVTRPGQSLE